MSLFFSKKLSFALIVAIAAIITFDVNKYGSFKASKTGVFLKNSGALHYGELALTRFRTLSQQTYRWSQKHVPMYMTKVRESVAPSLLKLRNLLSAVAFQIWTNVKLVYQYFLDKKPIIVKWFNSHLPGTVDSLWKAWAFFKDYTLEVVALVLQYLSLAVQWLRNNVFVGKLSPENLQRFTMEALNTTQKLAIQTYSWLNNKMVTVSSSV